MIEIAQMKFGADRKKNSKRNSYTCWLCVDFVDAFCSLFEWPNDFVKASIECEASNYKSETIH